MGVVFFQAKVVKHESSIDELTSQVRDLNHKIKTQSDTLEQNSVLQTHLKQDAEREREEKGRLTQQVIVTLWQ